MRRARGIVIAALLIAGLGIPAFADDDKTKDQKETQEAKEKRTEIDKVAKETLDDLFAKHDKAKSAYDKAAGYAVFDNMKVAVVVTGGGGHGVAVNKSTGERTYMKMGTGGVGVGLGAQKYQVVMLFENKKALDDFIHHGWKATGTATASAGEKGANVGTEFKDGVAYYVLTEKGLMASADLSGTKYSVDEDLNKKK